MGGTTNSNTSPPLPRTEGKDHDHDNDNDHDVKDNLSSSGRAPRRANPAGRPLLHLRVEGQAAEEDHAPTVPQVNTLVAIWSWRGIGRMVVTIPSPIIDSRNP